MENFHQSLPMMLYRALQAVMPRFRAIFAEFDLTEPQWRVLRVLWDETGMNFRELAELTLLPPPSLVGIIDRLEHRDLVTRRRSASDRRQVTVHLTRKGKALEARVMPRVDAAYRDLRRAIPRADWHKLTAGLGAVAALDNNDPESTPARTGTDR